MNVKNNRRRRDSMERMEKALIGLLQERELEGITVSDICKQCGLNRSTFYANYQDIYALADKLRDRLEQEVMDLYLSGTADYFEGHDYLRLFRHMRDNQLFYKTYFKLGYDEKHAIKLYDTARAARDFDNQNIPYHIAFFQAGFNAVVKLWLAGSCQETPEEMQQIIRSEYQGRN